MQIRAGGGVTAAGAGDDEGAGAGGAVEFVAVEFVGGLERPGGILVGVAAVAGVGHAELHGEQRIGDGDAVVMARMALHVGGDGHVAGDALVAGAVRLVAAVGGGIDDRGGRLGAAGVAAHAEQVAGNQALAGVRVMAIDTTDAHVVHPA